MGLAAVPTTTTVPVTVLCNGPDKGLGRGVTRDESSVFRPPEAGLARGFATVPTATTVPVAVLCNGSRKGLGHDAMLGFRPL